MYSAYDVVTERDGVRIVRKTVGTDTKNIQDYYNKPIVQEVEGKLISVRHLFGVNLLQNVG